MAAGSPPSALATALQVALALAPPDQAQLCALLQRLTDRAADESLDRFLDPKPAPRAVADPQAAVDAWLNDIAVQPAWLRLQLLDEAIASCASDSDREAERELLQSAHVQLLRAHPPLAVRRTVTELAMLHPASTGIAVIGLLLGLTGLVRLLLRGLF